jgi:hypothetical protein
MNYAQAQRELRAITDYKERRREEKIKRVQATFGMDRKTAAHTLEWIELKFANQTFASTCGLFTAIYVHRKLTPLLQGRSLLFKKPWMVPIVPAVGFFCAYIGARELRARRLMGRDGCFEKMSGSTDIISRFRDLEEVLPNDFEGKNSLVNYLSTFTGTTKSDVYEYLSKYDPDKIANRPNRIYRRADSDLDDLKYMFGKIHGLENIAFVDDKELED